MKRILLALAFITAIHGATFPYILFYDYNGPYTVIAGSTTVEAWTARPGFNWTVNATTDVFTVTTSGVTLTNGMTIQVEETNGGVGWTANTLPSGMFGMVNGLRAVYAVCNVGGGGTTYQLKYDSTPIVVSQVPPTCSSPTTLNVTDTGSGTQTASIMGVIFTDQVYLNADPTGYPTSTTFSYKNNNSLTNNCTDVAPTSMGKPYTPYYGQMCVFVSVPIGATPGTTTTHRTICMTDTGTNCTTYDFPINVVAAPTVSFTPPSSFPAFSKTGWEEYMIARPCPGFTCGSTSDPTTLSGPANFCDPPASPSPVTQLGAAVNAGVSFYGWNLLFDNMTIYTGNPVYRSGCFQVAMGHTGASDLQSVRFFVVNNGGVTTNFATFSESLFRAARVFGDSTYSDAGLLLTHFLTIQTGQGPIPGPRWLREDAFGLNIAVDLKKYGGVTNAYLSDARDVLYSFVLRATEPDASGVRMPQQGFIMALAMHALIKDWQTSGDNRIEYVVKRYNDYIWAHYDQSTHKYTNLEGPSLSPWCANDMSAADFFTPGDGGLNGCGNQQDGYQVLQAMIVHEFFWYYAMTGDSMYQTEGDDLWDHFIDHTDATGKAASQIWYDSFNSVGWRTGTLSPDKWYGDASPPGAHAASVRRYGGSRN